MMKNNVLKVCIAVVCILTSCASSDSVCNLVNVNIDSKKMSMEEVEKFLTANRLLPVVFQGDSIIEISKYVVGTANVFVLDYLQKKVFKVNMKTGLASLVCSQVGSARNEYHNINDIAIDAKENLYLYDSDQKKVNVYTSQGKYFRTINAPIGESIAVGSKGDLSYNLSGFAEETIVATYSNKGELKFSSFLDMSKKTVTVKNGKSICLDGHDNVYYTTPFNNSIFKMSNGMTQCVLKFDFGSKNVDVEKIEKMNDDKFRDYFMKSEDIMYLSDLYASDNLLFVSANSLNLLVYDTKSKKVSNLSNCEFPYNIFLSTPLSMNKKNEFCTFVSGKNYKNGLLPALDSNEKLKSLSKDGEYFSGKKNAAFWMVIGKVKK